ncbi:MAG TPA: tRNA (guanosine(46)-N7)-methyltransferase TrmB [Stellaceae bacterium]|jgi:tRNA (guanine-N7-)-methyltransferase|nr:tRNA (guanosine(46)-N7)-methyltransferase TrmB [Stellaceae bacterium]
MSCAARSEDLAEVSDHRELFYGRRRGRPLRAGQRERQSTLLPQLSFAVSESGCLDLAGLFAASPREIWLEIGFGGGEHLAEQAERHPAIGFIGCEVFENGVAKLLGEIDRRGLANVRVYPNDARPLLAALAPRSVGRVFILFPDPWPKARHHKRRLVAPATLDRLAEIMADGGELRLATDDPSYLSWMLEHATAHPEFSWTARRPSDWRERPADWPATRYEGKARKAGRIPAFLRFVRRARRIA